MKKNKIFPLRALLVVALFCFLASLSAGRCTRRKPPQEVATFIACYFVDSNGHYTWQWALNEQNQGLTFNGTWITTRPGEVKFASREVYSKLAGACERARIYHQEQGILKAFFAADAGYSRNYRIVLNGYELFSLS